MPEIYAQPGTFGKYKVEPYKRLRFHGLAEDPPIGGGHPILIGPGESAGAILVDTGVTLDYDTTPIQPLTRSDFIAQYKVGRYASPRLYFNGDINGPAVPPPDTAVNFVAKYPASALKRFLFNSRDESEGFIPSGLIESGANPHFVARYNPGIIARCRFVHEDIQGPAPGGAGPVSTETYFIAKYNVGALRIFGRNLHNDIDFNAIAQPQPNTDLEFIARYQQPKYQIFGKYLSRDGDPGAIAAQQPDGQNTFIAKYAVGKYGFFWPGPAHNTDLDIPIPQAPNTPSFIAKYDGLSSHYIKAIRQNPDILQTKPHVEPPPAVPAARVIAGHPAVPLWQPTSPQTWIARIGDISRTSLSGHVNVTLTVTLNTGVTTTTVIDVRIGINSGLILVPQTSNAAAIHASVYVSAQKSGQATLTHSSTGNTDCTFNLVIIG